MSIYQCGSTYNRHLCDPARAVVSSTPFAWQRQTMCDDLRSDSWGRPHALPEALRSTNLRLGLGYEKQAVPSYFSGYRSSERNWPNSNGERLLFYFIYLFYFFFKLSSVTVYAYTVISNSGATRGVTVSMSAFLACHQC